jgi:undecaprenyl-diphosphatase
MAFLYAKERSCEVDMEYLQAIILGLVQGITEFLPISSTAHLIIFRDILGWEAVTCAQDAAKTCVPHAGWSKVAIDGIQLGSVGAVFVYFWKDITQIVAGSWQAFQAKDWRREEWKILVGIAIGTCPALLIGLAMKVKGIQLESPMVIGVMSIIMALLLGAAEQVGKRERDFHKLKILDGVIVGAAQAIALLPGASRSGSTITASLFMGLKRETAARFSFLLGLPTLTIVTLVQTKDVLQDKAMILPMIVGIIATFIFSYMSIAWLIKFLQKQTNWIFVWYRLAFGLAILTAIAAGNGKLPNLGAA